MFKLKIFRAAMMPLMMAAGIVWAAQPAQAQDEGMPHLEKTGNTMQLIVDGEPFIMLAGELHNSSTGSSHYMAPIWQRMADKNLNTVIAAVSWELVEPQEGKFDFRLVDEMIEGARKANLRLVLLWFGSWKNGLSKYAPSWVKRDAKRFPLARLKSGLAETVISPLCENAAKADAKAFSKLMAHLKEVDGERHTVIAVQLENEIGTLDRRATYLHMPNGGMRDYSEQANKAFAGQVPGALIQYLKANKKSLHPAIATVWNTNGSKTSGTWEEVFGKGLPSSGTDDWQNEYPYLTEEIFNAWHYATYVEQLAAAGKNIYPLPFYMNAWLKQPGGSEPGCYPSGGPQPHLFDIWHAGAPHVDLYGPDLYETSMLDWVLSTYDTTGNPILMPETRSSSDGAARAFYTFGRYNTICYSPFGIDGGGLILSADSADHSYDRTYKLLSHLKPYITKYYGTKQKNGLLLDKGRERDEITMGKYKLSLRPLMLSTAQAVLGVAGADGQKEPEVNVGGAIIFQTGEDEFLLAGGIGEFCLNIQLTDEGKGRFSSFESVDEITFTDDGQELIHRLNGDETAFGGVVFRKGHVQAFRVKMYEFR